MKELVEISGQADYETARGLFVEYATWLGVDLGFQRFQVELEQLPAMYGPPGGSLILARKDGMVVGCVGVRHLSPGTCEMKRLFVREAARGLGVGKDLAVAAVRAGRRLGHKRMVLDTLEKMTGARHIYAELGFAET